MNYTEMESKVREATNDDPWGPTGQLMQELAQATFSYEHFPEVMAMLWRRMLIDNQSNWRRTYKALIVLNYIVKNGAERAVTSAREHIYDLKTLENYTHIDETGKDCGANVRIRVKQLIDFIQNDDALREERKKAKQNRDKFIGVASDGHSYGSSGVKFNSVFTDSPARDDIDSNFRGAKLKIETKCNVPSTSKVSPSTEDSDKIEKKSSSRDFVSKQKVDSTRGESIVEQPTSTQQVGDLLSGFDMNPNSIDTKKDEASPKDSSNPSKSNTDADLKEIVKGIDIFSNKRPRPVKSNKSNIPNFTLKNPNPPFTSAKNSSAINVSSPSSENLVPTGASNNKIPNETVGSDSFESIGKTSSKQELNSTTVDEFDLLSINPDPLETVISPISAESNKLSVMDEISSLSLESDDPFGINRISVNHSSTSMGSNLPTSTLDPILHQTSTGILDSKPVQPIGSKKSALPDTWNSLVAGTKFNLDLDNLLKPESSKSSAPSLNELAKGKPDNDDLFG